jgi:hypothetical protein
MLKLLAQKPRKLIFQILRRARLIQQQTTAYVRNETIGKDCQKSGVT